jgi:hypothetical protein
MSPGLDSLLLIVVAGLLALMWRELRQRRRAEAIHSVLSTFGAAQSAVHQDARLLLVWQPLSEAARRLFPEAFASLDAATGQRFPFPKSVIERAHSKWTADWLAWEKAHDEEYRLKAADIEQELDRASGDARALAKARLERVQHEKIERYQQRYEEYIRTAKSLQALLE